MPVDANLPTTPGVYLAFNLSGDGKWQEIDVYEHDIKGLCCFADDFGSSGTGVDDETDCHVSVQCSGIEFGKRVRDLD